ncbi:hypothetical protein BU15DRAFT_16883, partial [Melanogaster broomeanus]
EEHYHIGRTENFPVNLSQFAQGERDDPATVDFVLQLKAHLLLRIKAMHVEESSTEGGPCTLNQIVFKNDRIYRHNILRINYTTYNICRAQDVVHPNTEHHNVMLLAADFKGTSQHPFCYARVLGIYHANVIYIGPGSRDYQARRLDFLWVRWYKVVDMPSGWCHQALDALQFAPMMGEDAFGFIDPADVLRGCHLIPAFDKGKLHPDGVAMSHYARDANDWKLYYVNRFVDRDMVLRYHWGLAVGHRYA